MKKKEYLTGFICDQLIDPEKDTMQLFYDEIIPKFINTDSKME